MAPLVDYEFDLDGNRFGIRDSPVVAHTVDFGAAEWTVQDTDNPVGDGQLFGRDYLRAPLWTFEMGTDRYEATEALDALTALAQAWRTAGGRNTPGSYAVLRYALGGRTRRVYGRPRRWSSAPDALLKQGYVPITADFQLMDPLHYDDAAQSLTLGLVATGGSGLVLPTVLPAVLGDPPGERQGVVYVDGDTPTPFTVTISGPVSGTASGFHLRGPGWYIDVNRSIAYDQSITIDTRSHTVIRSDGASLAGGLTRRSDLAARLRPGVSELTFSASDPTNTCSATFEWRAARVSL